MAIAYKIVPMASNYPIHFADQLREHIRALRKNRGMTQNRLGQLLGVSQARIAEIEGNPGLVSLDQMLQIFSALDATLSLTDDQSVQIAPTKAPLPAANRIGKVKPAPRPKPALDVGQRYSQYAFAPRYSLNAPTVQWKPAHGHRVADNLQPDWPAAPAAPHAESSRGSPLDNADNPAPKTAKSRQHDTRSDAKPISHRTFNFPTKEGTW
ncbi:MAG: transcriptional regulator, family [Herminiimonas sp.]|nr:transcriptional regulator, family [Herminiimonas sp.]